MAVAAEHHERLDGSGYPRGLRGFQISPMGRMATIVDVYDAMTAQRIYHQGMEPAEALQRLYQGYPGCFDEDLVQHFIQALGIYPVGSLVRLESNRLAVVVGQNRSGMLHPVVRVFHDITSGQDLPPFDLDLSGADDAVRGHENPADWKLDPHAWTAWGAEA
jgi:HD-GYP domain-containing protein (c-di-GMP phosphodiesterase class II)